MPHRPARGSKRGACRIQYHCNQAGEGPPCRKQNWSRAPGQPQQQSHGLALRDRRHLAVTGVSRVISCDESAAVLETPLGNLTVGGQERRSGSCPPRAGRCRSPAGSNTCSMRKISSPAAVCWRGSSVRWPRHPPRGRCWGMCCGALGWAVCWRACGMPCALHWGRARCAAFSGI